MSTRARPTAAERIAAAEARIPLVDAARVPDIVARGGTSMIVFYLGDCEPCHALLVRLTRIVDELGRPVPLYRVDAERSRPLASTYHVAQAPTVLVFANGNEVGRYVGLIPEQTIRSAVRPLAQQGLSRARPE